ncbi:Cytochrome monooxygenase lcsI [Penicillium atrosanguineum]|nr:Cytochrome monooxygenase lcsI [Penicillium atrosanguineum]
MLPKLETLKMTSLFSLATIALAAYLLWIILYNLYISPLSKYPGPKLAACTNLPNLYWTSTGQYHYKLKDLHDKYGDVVRAGPQTLVYRTPQAWKDIYSHRKSGTSSYLKDPKFYLQGPRGPSILNANDADHSRTRRLLSHAFSEKALRDQEALIQSYVDMLINRLQGEIASSRKVVDMSQWYNFTTFDIIGDLAFGEPFDCLKNSQYHPWVKMLFSSMKVLALRRPLAIYPFLAPIVSGLMPKRLVKMREEHFALTAEKVHRRLETKTDRPDFMAYILRVDDDRSLTAREMEANAAILIMAGSETTASLLSGFTFYALTNAGVWKKLVEEVRGAFGSYDEIDFKEVSQLGYLNAALEESLRVYPPVPATIPRIVPEGGAVIDGEFVPQGVTMSPFTRDGASLFTDADSFIPERWLENRDKRFESDCRTALQAFSLGPRNCLGRNLAYAEMRLIAAKMLWSFDMTLDESSASWNIQKAYNIWERKPLMVKLSLVLH